MSTLSEFMAGSGRPDEAPAERRGQSTSHGPVVVLKGWREGMNKVGLTLLLRDRGVPLSEAHDATNAVLKGKTVTVRLPEGSDLDALRAELGRLGVVV
jgi:hypothetical protein